MKEYITLKQAAEELPTKPHHCTIWRWCVKGIFIPSLNHPIRLEHFYIGRRIVTTREWLEQFLEKITEAKILDHRASNTSGRKFIRVMQIVHAEEVLRRAGI